MAALSEICDTLVDGSWWDMLWATKVQLWIEGGSLDGEREWTPEMREALDKVIYNDGGLDEIRQIMEVSHGGTE